MRRRYTAKCNVYVEPDGRLRGVQACHALHTVGLLGTILFSSGETRPATVTVTYDDKRPAPRRAKRKGGK